MIKIDLIKASGTNFKDANFALTGHKCTSVCIWDFVNNVSWIVAGSEGFNEQAPLPCLILSQLS